MTRAILTRLIELFPPLDTVWSDDLRCEWWRLYLIVADAACEADGYARTTVEVAPREGAWIETLPWSVNVPHD